jgi:tRNA-2-methylthio-N6-dimethylallyladenosine synthase
MVGTAVEILCEGPSKTNADRLMGRTRTNKIVIIDGGARLTGQLFDVRITRATGFSLYGDPAIPD